MTTDIICIWRDAITDPPPDGWHGVTRAHTGGDLLAVSVGAFWYDAEFYDLNPRIIHPEKWLDVTDAPAVPRAAVQAAVDMLRDMAVRAMDHPEETNPQATASMRHACRVVMGHTGVTPSEVTP